MTARGTSRCHFGERETVYRKENAAQSAAFTFCCVIYNIQTGLMTSQSFKVIELIQSENVNPGVTMRSFKQFLWLVFLYSEFICILSD